MNAFFVEDIDPQALASRLDGPNRPLVLDVREPWERSIAAIEPSMHIPMADVPDRLDELDRSRDIVVLCHHGRRSRQVVVFLKQCGFPRVLNLAGGIDAWSADVDPAVPVY